MTYSSFDELWTEIEKEEEYAAEKAKLSFVSELEKLIQKRGITRKEYAEKLGKSQPYVSKVFRGEENFTIKTMTTLLKALDGKLSIHATPKEEGQVDWLRVLNGKKQGRYFSTYNWTEGTSVQLTQSSDSPETKMEATNGYAITS